MKKSKLSLWTIAAALFLSLGVSAQNDIKKVEDEVSAQFIDAYNKEDFKKATSDFNESMLKTVSSKKIEALYKQLGKINKCEFSGQENNWSIYKVTFEKSVLYMKIILDEKNKIAGLLFTPDNQGNLRATYDQVWDRFINAYNKKDFKTAAADFNKKMLKAVPAEAIEGIYDQLGKINKSDFTKMAKEAFVYKITFEKGIMDMQIVLDANNKIAGLQFLPHKEKPSVPVIERNSTGLILPFKGEWFVFWGGDTKELNYHSENIAQKNAFDIVIIDSDNKTHKSEGNTNEDYYAFGQEIITPCDAIVIDVIDGVLDNVPGEMNKMNIMGNSVILKTANNEYLFFAHFKQGSIKVKSGETIKSGETLGLCGNSGNSSEPHLHFHIQNTNDLATGTGAKCYFKEITVKRNGKSETKKDYSPVKGDIISQDQ